MSLHSLFSPPFGAVVRSLIDSWPVGVATGPVPALRGRRAQMFSVCLSVVSSQGKARGQQQRHGRSRRVRFGENETGECLCPPAEGGRWVGQPSCFALKRLNAATATPRTPENQINRGGGSSRAATQPGLLAQQVSPGCLRESRLPPRRTENLAGSRPSGERLFSAGGFREVGEMAPAKLSWSCGVEPQTSVWRRRETPAMLAEP